MKITPSWRDRLRGLAPWPVRRFVRSAAEDLKTLPTRFADPQRWADPWNVAHNNGGGDFLARGRSECEMLQRAADLSAEDRVLDIGCGQGALALALSAVLSPRGGYVGFDVSASAIAFCRRRIGAVRPDFRFEHADLHNGDYNPSGRLSASQYRFPVEDRSVTLAVACSVFTHLSASDSAAYLAETARVLAPAGRLVASFFLLDDEARAAIAAGRARRAFVHPALGGWTNNPDTPEAGIAHEEARVRQWAQAAGLSIERIERGDWRAPASGLGGHDLVLARRQAAHA